MLQFSRSTCVVAGMLALVSTAWAPSALASDDLVSQKVEAALARLGGPAAVAETEAEAAEDGASQEAAPAPATAGPMDKLQVHGFLTQSYATADFAKGGFSSPTSDEIFLGIPEDGTSEYRNLAIQFRYEVSPKNVMVVQFAHRRFGDSPFNEIADEVELDWAFYEHRFRDNTSIKVGKVQIPFGIFNEVRDVGTVLPFFRPAFVFYREGTFTTETVDGLVFSHTFAPQSDWNLEFDIYGGGWDLVEQPANVPTRVIEARAEDAFGTQLWVNTPVSGLRFGAGGQRYSVEGGALRRPGEKTTWTDWHASIDAVFDRWVARAEYRELDFPINFVPSPAFGTVLSDTLYTAYYLQFGVNATEKLAFYVQGEFSDLEQASRRFTGPLVTEGFRDDVGFAVNYAFLPNVVLKAEHHQVDLNQPGFAGAVPTPEGLKLVPRTRKATDGSYSIVSLSASF